MVTDDERQELYELSLHGIGTVALNAMEDSGDIPPLWRPFKRARWWGRYDALHALATAAIDYERQQYASWRAQRL